MKVAIVTGASRGIGACVAEGLASDGYSVALIARSKDGLEELANKISKNKAGSSVSLFPLDVQDESAIKNAVAAVHSKFGRIDLLFNNAGTYVHGTLEVESEDFDQAVAINLKAPFVFLQSVVPIMKAQKSGMILNVASRAGKIGFADCGTYGATKFGLVGLSESLYRELSPLGIKVTALCPSWVDTDMASDSKIPTKEMLRPDDILKTIHWLESMSPAAVVREIVIECNKHTA